MKLTAQDWERRYAEGHSPWSGHPNASLVEQAAGLEPGTALDLGCGTGADAIWLASRGWTVTAVDIAEAALATAREDAAAAGVGDRITWIRSDLGAGLPDGPYDLVTAAFLHGPVSTTYTELLRRAADAVAPGGTLLVIGHAPSAAHAHAELESAADVAAGLALDPRTWTTVTEADVEREHAFPGEHAHARVDAILALRRARR